MSLASEIMGGGFSAAQAIAIGGCSGTLTATGASSTLALAALIKTTSTIVNSGDGTKSVILPAVQPGESVTIFNNSASTLPVFPPVGAAIAVPGTGLGLANASYAHTTYAACTYTCVTATQWLVEKSA